MAQERRYCSLGAVVVVMTMFCWSLYHTDKGRHVQVLERIVANLTIVMDNVKNNHVIPTRVRDSHPGVYYFANEDGFLTSAFIDRRRNNSEAIVLALRYKKSSMNLFCVLTHSDGVTISKMKETRIYDNWPPNSLYIAVLYSCPVPKKFNQTLLRVATKDSDYNDIPLKYLRPTADEEKENLAVCVKATNGRINPMHLIEWFEFYRTLGMENFIIYVANVTGPANTVLDYYRELGIVELVPYTVLSEYTNKALWVKVASKGDYYSVYQQGYLLSINDCFLRYQSRFRHILLVDLDEFYIPYKNESIPNALFRMIQRHPKTAGFSLPTAWYFNDYGQAGNGLPSYFHALRHIRRSPVYTSQPKSFIYTEEYLFGNWHGAVSLVNGSTHGLNIFLRNTNEYGYIHHFRKACLEKFYENQCEQLLNTVETDQVLPKYVSVVSNRSMNVLKIVQGMQTEQFIYSIEN